jgi:hypothetical protein
MKRRVFCLQTFTAFKYGQQLVGEEVRNEFHGAGWREITADGFRKGSSIKNIAFKLTDILLDSFS